MSVLQKSMCSSIIMIIIMTLAVPTIMMPSCGRKNSNWVLSAYESCKEVNIKQNMESLKVVLRDKFSKNVFPSIQLLTFKNLPSETFGN